MRILLLFSLTILLSNCSTIEVAKEVTKATKSIKTSVDKIIKNSENDNNEEVSKEISSDKEIIINEIVTLEKETKAKIKEQKKKTKINFLNKTVAEMKLIAGEPNLSRIDGNSRTLRYDNRFCQLFLFSNSISKNSKFEYFEIRNKEGKLIIEEKKIDRCYNNFKLS